MTEGIIVYCEKKPNGDNNNCDHNNNYMYIMHML
jgi:hypothetical protein